MDEENYPDAYSRIIRRLRKAMEDPQKRREIELEDDIVKEFQDKERQIEEKSKAIIDMSKAIADKDQTIAELEKKVAELKQNRK